MQNFALLLLQQQPGNTNPLFSFLPLALIIVIFYFLIFVPMQRQKKQQSQMLSGLQEGNEVLTTGGVVGTIVKLSEDTMVLRVKPDNVKLQFARSAVTGLVKEEKLPEKKNVTAI